MQYAYLDGNGVVVATSTVAREISLPQFSTLRVVQRIDGAPDALVPNDDNGEFIYTKISGDGTSIEDYSVQENLKPLKKLRYREIDNRTRELIQEGFSYSGKIFSLSGQAQNNMLGVKAAIAAARAAGAEAAFEQSFFPLDFNTLDDMQDIQIATIADYEAFYDAGMLAVRAILDGGTGLKKQIRAAVTRAEVNAVVDDR